MKVTMKVFYPDGKPDGVISIKKANASGDAIAFPRDLCADICRDERYSNMFAWPCVYVLWHPGAHNQKPIVYIGESDSFARRITQHQNKKEFWTRAVVYTDTNGDLSTSHIEAKLWQCAKNAQVCEVKNKQEPRERAQSEADAATTESHIYDLTRFFLPLAGCDFFRQRDNAIAEQKNQKKAPTKKAEPVVAVSAFQSMDLHLRKKGIKAKGRETDAGFLVYANSQMTKKEAPSLHTRKRKKNFVIREHLKKEKLLVDDGEVYRLTQDCTFRSSSEAATVILGVGANGFIKWKDADGRTLGELQRRKK